MRLVTRSDFDGLICTVLLKELSIIDDLVYVHPKDLQDGKFEVTANDVLANVPYVEGCGLWFDHHSSEQERNQLEGKYEGRSEHADSAARVIYNYYGDEKLKKYDEVMRYVDIADSARFTINDLVNPQGWILLSFLCDPRSGLGYHKGYRVSNMQLMKQLIDAIMTKPVEEILELPDVKERAVRYFEQEETHTKWMVANSRTDGPVIITDSRGKSDIPPGNRFVVYALWPDATISLRAIDGKNKENVAISLGHSIFNRTSKVDVGSLMLSYGGGGHRAVGTCQVPYDDAERVIGEIVTHIKSLDGDN